MLPTRYLLPTMIAEAIRALDPEARIPTAWWSESRGGALGLIQCMGDQVGVTLVDPHIHWMPQGDYLTFQSRRVFWTFIWGNRQIYTTIESNANPHVGGLPLTLAEEEALVKKVCAAVVDALPEGACYTLPGLPNDTIYHYNGVTLRRDSFSDDLSFALSSKQLVDQDESEYQTEPLTTPQVLVVMSHPEIQQYFDGKCLTIPVTKSANLKQHVRDLRERAKGSDKKVLQNLWGMIRGNPFPAHLQEIIDSFSEE